MGQNIWFKNVQEKTQWKVGLSYMYMYVLDRSRYLALLTRKWQYLTLKGKETGTEHVAIATSKWVNGG